MLRSWIFVVAVPIAVIVTNASSAQNYPDRPIRMVVPQPPGGNMDSNARALSDILTRDFGQNIVIDNRGGANGIIAGDLVARAAANGYTILYTSNSFVNNQIVQKKLPFDVIRDFAPITDVANLPGYLILVNPKLPARSIGELVALSKNAGKPLHYGSGGIGNSQHLLGEFFNMRSGARLAHVPYKGFALLLTALLGDEIQVAFGAPTVVMPHVKAGRLRVLAYTGKERWSGMPDVPTVAQSGVPGFAFEAAWHGMFAPAATPGTIVSRIQVAVAKAIRTPGMQKHLENGGYAPVGNAPADFVRFLKDYLENIKEIARVSGIRPQ